MTNEILGRENKSIKGIAENIINHADFYTKEEVKEVYTNLTKDNRLSQTTKIKLLDGLRKVYKNK